MPREQRVDASGLVLHRRQRIELQCGLGVASRSIRLGLPGPQHSAHGDERRGLRKNCDRLVEHGNSFAGPVKPLRQQVRLALPRREIIGVQLQRAVDVFQSCGRIARCPRERPGNPGDLVVRRQLRAALPLAAGRVGVAQLVPGPREQQMQSRLLAPPRQRRVNIVDCLPRPAEAEPCDRPVDAGLDMPVAKPQNFPKIGGGGLEFLLLEIDGAAAEVPAIVVGLQCDAGRVARRGR